MIFSVSGAGALVGVDNLSLRDAGSGIELLRNGSFSAANDYWFFCSYRNQFPWHVKNFAVNTYFEQGWIGVVAMSLLLLFLGGDLAIRGLHGDTVAALGLAALAGFLVVGMFDSLFDVPRLTVACFLVAFAAVMRPAKGPASGDSAPRRRKRVRREPEVQPAEAPVRQAEKSSIAP